MSRLCLSASSYERCFSRLFLIFISCVFLIWFYRIWKTVERNAWEMLPVNVGLKSQIVTSTVNLLTSDVFLCLSFYANATEVLKFNKRGSGGPFRSTHWMCWIFKKWTKSVVESLQYLPQQHRPSPGARSWRQCCTKHGEPVFLSCQRSHFRVTFAVFFCSPRRINPVALNFLAVLMATVRFELEMSSGARSGGSSGSSGLFQPMSLGRV